MKSDGIQGCRHGVLGDGSPVYNLYLSDSFFGGHRWYNWRLRIDGDSACIVTQYSGETCQTRGEPCRR